MEDYEAQAQKFLEKTKTDFKAVFLKHDKYFNDDKESRDIYEITLKRGEREYKFRFGNSINASGRFIVFSPDGRKKYNDLKQANKDHGSPMLTRGEYNKNKNFKEPSAYDVLAALQKYDTGNFEFFCSNFGYDTDSIKALKTYNAVVEEYNNLKMLFNEEEMELLREIN